MNRKERRAAAKGRPGGSAPAADPRQAFAAAVAAFQGGRHEDAKAALAPVLRAHPDSPEALTLAGAIDLAAGNAATAVAYLEKAKVRAPASAEIHEHLGLALDAAGRADDAADAFRRSLDLRPGNPGALNNLGNALRRGGHFLEAAEAYRQSLRLRPGHADTTFNLGVALEELSDWKGAEAAYRESLAAAPDDPAATLNLGRVLIEQRRIEEALPVCERATALAPNSADAQSNLARAASSLGLIDRAEQASRRALEIDPDHAAARQALGTIHFLRGDWAAAWREYEIRWQTARVTRTRSFRPPIWAGEPLAGKAILVWGEQGVGDEILFAGMIPDLIGMAGRVVFECDPRLLALFRRSFPEAVCVPRDDPPVPETLADDIAYQAPSGSLGLRLRPDERSFPRRPSFLRPDVGLRDRLAARYRDGTNDRLVGVSWASVGPDKSMALGTLAPLFGVEGVRFVDLQYGDWRDTRDAFERSTGKRLLHDDAVDPLGDLDAATAQVAAMDLVISISNTAVHMAGALGVPTWLMLPIMPMWRWGAERDDSPWYPSLRLFRQRVRDDWADVVGRIRPSLVEFANRPTAPKT